MSRSWLLRCIALLLVVATLLMAVLHVGAWVLIFDQRGSEVDALVIWDQCDDRFEVAAQFVREDPKRRILLFEAWPERVMELGVVPTKTELAWRELNRRQVPVEQIEVIPSVARDRCERLRHLASWLAQHPEYRVALLCERFASRELQQVLRVGVPIAEQMRVDVWALPYRDYDEKNWWRSRRGIRQLVLRGLSLAYTCTQNDPAQASVRLDVEQYEDLVKRKLAGH